MNLAHPDKLEPLKGLNPRGQVVYKDKVEDVSASRIDAEFKEVFKATITRVAGDEPLTKVPKFEECRFCDIPKAECPEKVTSAHKTDKF